MLFDAKDRGGPKWTMTKQEANFLLGHVYSPSKKNKLQERPEYQGVHFCRETGVVVATNGHTLAAARPALASFDTQPSYVDKRSPRFPLYDNVEFKRAAALGYTLEIRLPPDRKNLVCLAFRAGDRMAAGKFHLNYLGDKMPNFRPLLAARAPKPVEHIGIRMEYLAAVKDFSKVTKNSAGRLRFHGELDPILITDYDPDESLWAIVIMPVKLA